MALDYSSRDYSTIKADLLRRASTVMPEWTDRDSSDFGMLLVDLWAHMGDVLHYYVDRAAGEYYLSTSTQRESALAAANLFDYSPRGRTSAAGTVTLRNNGSENYTVARLTQFIALVDGVAYQAYASVSTTIPAGGTASVPLFEGTVTSDEVLTDAASGSFGQRYTLRSKNAVESTVNVYVKEDGVNSTQYRRVDRIVNATSYDRAFTTKVDADGYTQVIFGNSTYGFVPPNSSEITASYVVSSGASGNLPANSVTAFKDGTPVSIVVESSTKFAGGNDAESIDSLKAGIPLIVNAQDRAVTANDFRSLAFRVPDVSKVAVDYNDGTKTVTIYAQEDRTSDYTADLSDDDLLESGTSGSGPWGQVVSSVTSTAVLAAIENKSLLGVSTAVSTEIEWTPINIGVTLHLNPTAVAPWVQSAVEDALDALFSFANVSFGQVLNLGTVYRTVLAVDGVDWAEVTTFNVAGSTGIATNHKIEIDSLKLPHKGTFTVTIDSTDSGVQP